LQQLADYFQRRCHPHAVDIGEQSTRHLHRDRDRDEQLSGHPGPDRDVRVDGHGPATTSRFFLTPRDRGQLDTASVELLPCLRWSSHRRGQRTIHNGRKPKQSSLCQPTRHAKAGGQDLPRPYNQLAQHRTDLRRRKPGTATDADRRSASQQTGSARSTTSRPPHLPRTQTAMPSRPQMCDRCVIDGPQHNDTKRHPTTRHPQADRYGPYEWSPNCTARHPVTFIAVNY
jgi:hypothetical protein